MNVTHLTVAGLLVALAGWCVAAEPQVVVRLKGGDALGAKLVPQLAEAFKAVDHGDVRFEIVAEGSSTAIAGLMDGSADIGMMSRLPKPEEETAARAQGVTFRMEPVCRDMLAVVVHETNPLRALTRQQVAAIFTGDVKDWGEVGGKPGKISVHHRNTASAVYGEWKQMAMDGRDYAPGASKVSGGDHPAMLVAGDPMAITYVGAAYAKMPGIAAVAVDGLQAVPEHLLEYAYTRRHWFVVPADPSPAAARFLAFTRGGEARKIIRRVGFLPEQAMATER